MSGLQVSRDKASDGGWRAARATGGRGNRLARRTPKVTVAMLVALLLLALAASQVADRVAPPAPPQPRVAAESPGGADAAASIAADTDLVHWLEGWQSTRTEQVAVTIDTDDMVHWLEQFQRPQNERAPRAADTDDMVHWLELQQTPR